MTDETKSTSAVSLAGSEPLTAPAARLQRWEIVTVFAVSLGASGLYALVQFIGSLTARQSLAKQTAVLNGSLAPGRPLFDLFLQLLNITLALGPVLLGFYLLEAGSLDVALDWAAKMPIMRYGTVEVRPVREGMPWQTAMG